MVALERRGRRRPVPVRERGVALVDVVCTLGLAAVLAGMAVPPVGAWIERDRARLAARYLAGLLHRARMEALTRNGAVAIRFGAAAEGYPFRLFADGDGDGVREDDVAGGIDRPVTTMDRVEDHFDDAGLRIVADVPDAGGAGLVRAGSDPLHIGHSRFLSFGPTGTCTSGTLFVGSGAASQAAVRLLGATGRARVLWFDKASGSWRPD